MPRRTSSSSGGRARALALVAALVFIQAPLFHAQVRYASGQDVVPVFEGWEKNPDGSFNMVFGYMNRNYEEEIDLPVGADNMLEPGVADQGQPTHFYTRRQQFVYKVRVPKDWGKKDLVWTIKVAGKVEKAYASLLPFWELGDFVYQENRGSTSTITDKPEPNEAPSIRIVGAAAQSVAAGQPLTLVAEVKDDGHPAPRRAPAAAGAASTAGAAAAATAVRRDSDGAVITATGTPGPGGTGPRRENPLTQAVVRLDPGVSLGVTWIVYRGSNVGVTFQPQRVAVADGKVQSKVTFAKPGTYTLRAYADDSIFVTAADLTVTVK